MKNTPHFFTFYSYKGGVGRSMALMNCAWELAGKGRHVLMVDMDLEAPGLSGFLERSGQLQSKAEGEGDLLDLLHALVEKPIPAFGTDRYTEEERQSFLEWIASFGDLSNFIREVKQDDWPDDLRPDAGPVGRLDLLGLDEQRDYMDRLARCGIRDLTGDPLARLASGLRGLIAARRFDVTSDQERKWGVTLGSDYDYVLIDSRTGITEIGGACLGPLSDRVIVLLGLNDQNIEGTRTILEETGLFPLRERPGKEDPWDSGVPGAYMYSGKPFELVASPVPTGEIIYKRDRKRRIAERIAPVRLQLTYHPLLALEEHIFVSDYREESLANEYAKVARRIMWFVGDEASEWMETLVEAIQEKQWSTAVIAARKAACLNRTSLGILLFHLLSRTVLTETEITSCELDTLCSFVSTPSRVDEDDLLFWGNALMEQAEQKRGAESDQLLAEAGEKYAQAVAIKPDMHGAFNNWGNALLNQAKQKQGAESDRLFAAAYEKYEQAVSIKPDKHEAFNNWGNALTEQAKQKQGAESDRLFAEGYEKYAQAVSIKPKFHGTFSNWGNALTEQAKQKQGAESDKLFAEACKNYAQAVSIKPDFRDAFSNWGVALMDQAKQKQGAESDRLFAEAHEKLEKALSIDDTNSNTLYNLGCFHASQGNSLQAVSFLTKAKEARYNLSQSKIADDTDFDCIRTEPEFIAFVETLPEK